MQISGCAEISARRDFVNGVGVAVTGAVIAPGGSALEECGWDPEAGILSTRSHGNARKFTPGSFEVAHALRDGNTWTDVADTGEHYDLVVVGGGLSGLSAAYFFMTSAGPGARVLVLDNHDDFGGHAKRNRDDLPSRTLMINGGTSYLESVSQYSTVARTLLAAIGIDVESATATSDAGRGLYRSLGLGNATFFAKEVFGEDRLVKGEEGAGSGSSGWADWLAQTPMSPDAQRDIARLYDDEANPNYLPDCRMWTRRSAWPGSVIRTSSSISPKFTPMSSHSSMTARRAASAWASTATRRSMDGPRVIPASRG